MDRWVSLEADILDFYGNLVRKHALKRTNRRELGEKKTLKRGGKNVIFMGSLQTAKQWSWGFKTNRKNKPFNKQNNKVKP